MNHIILVGKAKDLFKELEKMLKLQQATGLVLMKYEPETQGGN